MLWVCEAPSESGDRINVDSACVGDVVPGDKGDSECEACAEEKGGDISERGIKYCADDGDALSSLVNICVTMSL